MLSCMFMALNEKKKIFGKKLTDNIDTSVMGLIRVILLCIDVGSEASGFFFLHCW